MAKNSFVVHRCDRQGYDVPETGEASPESGDSYRHKPGGPMAQFDDSGACRSRMQRGPWGWA